MDSCLRKKLYKLPVVWHNTIVVQTTTKRRENKTMSTSVMQFRVDDELKAQAAAVCENLGIDLPTALRMFMKRTVLANGIPFNMTLPRQDYKAERAVRAAIEMSDAAKKSGLSDMSLEEINAEIAASRAEREEYGKT